MRVIRAFSEIVALIALVAFTASCASIINGGTQQVSIQSRPDAAKITVFDKSGQAIGGGTTPATMTLKRGAGFFSAAKYRVRFEKDGYAPREVPVVGKVSGWYIGGNFLFGGPIGWLIVDPATGGMWTLTPDDVRAELSAQHGAIWHDNSGFTVALKEQVPQQLLSHMKPVALN
jgi:hypothetical protein